MHFGLNPSCLGLIILAVIFLVWVINKIIKGKTVLDYAEYLQRDEDGEEEYAYVAFRDFMPQELLHKKVAPATCEGLADEVKGIGDEIKLGCMNSCYATKDELNKDFLRDLEASLRRCSY